MDLTPEQIVAGAHAIRIRLNREKTARRNDTPLHRHTRDCRNPERRASYARAHEGGRDR